MLVVKIHICLELVENRVPSQQYRNGIDERSEKPAYRVNSWSWSTRSSANELGSFAQPFKIQAQVQF